MHSIALFNMASIILNLIWDNLSYSTKNNKKKVGDKQIPLTNFYNVKYFSAHRTSLSVSGYSKKIN